MFCTGCGRELEEGALFCPECGRAVDGGGTAPDAGDAARSATPVLGPASPRPPARGPMPST